MILFFYFFISSFLHLFITAHWNNTTYQPACLTKTLLWMGCMFLDAIDSMTFIHVTILKWVNRAHPLLRPLRLLSVWHAPTPLTPLAHSRVRWVAHLCLLPPSAPETYHHSRPIREDTIRIRMVTQIQQQRLLLVLLLLLPQIEGKNWIVDE